MKVLHLIDSGGLYGAEKVLLALVKAQLEQGLEPMILSAGEPDITEKPLEAEAKRIGLPVTPWRMKPGLNIRESRKILKWAIANDYDILHSHGFKFNVLLGSYPEPLRRIPMVATLHGYVHARKFTKMWFYELLDRFAIFFLQGVVLVGDAMTKEIPQGLTKRKQVRVISNGLDIEAVKIKAVKVIDGPIKEFMDRHSPIVLGVGRLSPEKGFDRLIGAFLEVSTEFNNAGLIIVGEGEERKRLEEEIEKRGLHGRVVVPGYCNNVPGIQRRSDLLVMPSLTEGLPITLLEAMAVGLPVLASPVGDIPLVIENNFNGWIIDDSRPEYIGKNICNLLNVPLVEKEKVRVRALSTVMDRFSSYYMSKMYEEFYIDISSKSKENL